jgi:hypothetical protein
MIGPEIPLPPYVERVMIIEDDGLAVACARFVPAGPPPGNGPMPRPMPASRGE